MAQLFAWLSQQAHTRADTLTHSLSLLIRYDMILLVWLVNLSLSLLITAYWYDMILLTWLVNWLKKMSQVQLLYYCTVIRVSHQSVIFFRPFIQYLNICHYKTKH